jgi:hypothetical protein
MQRSRAHVGIVSLAALAMLSPSANLGAREPEQPVAGQKLPWQRLLNGEDAKKAKELKERMAKLQEAAKFEDALKVAEELAELRARVQGADHWEAVRAAWKTEGLRRVLRQSKAVQAAYAGAASLDSQCDELDDKGRYKEAQPLSEKVLAITRQALGEDHPGTALCLSNLGYYLKRQGKYAEAEVDHRTSVAIRRKTLGESHPDTAESYGNLAQDLTGLARYAEAEECYRKALAIRRLALGDDDPQTALTYHNLGSNLGLQGRYAEAESAIRTALTIRRKVLGEDNFDTAGTYLELAKNQRDQEKYPEAEAGSRTALTICLKTLGEDHPLTAFCYNHLAASLSNQGRVAEAETGFRKALAIRLQTLGESHPDTAFSYSNLAANLSSQGRFTEAEEGLRKSLEIERRLLGEEHPYTAMVHRKLGSHLFEQSKYAEAEKEYLITLAIESKVLGADHPDKAFSYFGLASIQYALGKYAEAEPGLRTALAIRRKALGEYNAKTVETYSVLARNQAAQGRYAEAEELGLLAADRFAKARLRVAASGLERSMATGDVTPLPELAVVLARNRKPADAWIRFEESLARGTWDDLSARLRRPAADQSKQAELAARLERLDRLIEKAIAPGEPAQEQKKLREDLLTQSRKIQDELNDFARRLEEKYGRAAGQTFDRATIQASLPADATQIGWLDLPGAPKAADSDGEHWAFMLRARGKPAVINLRGTGPGGHWTEADTKLPADLRTALQSPRGDWQPLAERLRKQRLDPLAEQLGAQDGLPVVRRLIVLPSTALAGVPVEAFADGYSVSYALSGTLYAYLHQQPKLETKGVLALADPVFERPAVPELPIPTAPPGGLLLTSVVAGSNAAQSGLKAGDVLLRYNGTTLASRTDLKALPESDDVAKRVAITVWRAGKTLDKELRPGKLGVALANDPAPQALAAKYEADRWLAKSRGGDDGKWDPLPGTRIEAEGLRKLLAGATSEPLVLADSEASEQRLYDLAKSGELGKYRYLHLATHGTVDDRFPLRSAIILSRDRLPDPDKQLDAGLPVFDGRLTAEKVLRQWHLNADLVTLSACQTALGKYEKGEGFVGFAQALILAGSRSVCLSLWKVDDTATALLMNRFYENLLGKRDGLKGPLSKADALAEAKSWLRGLSRDEAAQRAAKMSDGVARGKRPKLPPVLPAEVKEGEPREKASTDRDRPYAHPYYWAAFVLIGDPD